MTSAHPHAVLAKHLLPSRLIRADSLSTAAGVDIYLKLESEQPTGSFKVRGAIYALTERCQRNRVDAVVTASTGNHGAAVAYAARLLHVPATVFVPIGANPVKVDRIRSLGASIVEVGSMLTDAIDAAAAHAAASGHSIKPVVRIAARMVIGSFAGRALAIRQIRFARRAVSPASRCRSSSRPWRGSPQL